MSNECQTYPSDVLAAYTTASNRFGYIDSTIVWLYEHWTEFGTLTYHQKLHGLFNNLNTVLLYLVFGCLAQEGTLRVPYLFQNCLGGEFDMDILLSAMITATPEQLKKFIGLVDAYRQSLWNQEFDSEFFAALARGFEQWG
jgi:hypothetical protein